MYRIDLSASIGKKPAEQRKISANHEKSGQTVTEKPRLSACVFLPIRAPLMPGEI